MARESAQLTVDRAGREAEQLVADAGEQAALVSQAAVRTEADLIARGRYRGERAARRGRARGPERAGGSPGSRSRRSHAEIEQLRGENQAELHGDGSQDSRRPSAPRWRRSRSRSRDRADAGPADPRDRPGQAGNKRVWPTTEAHRCRPHRRTAGSRRRGPAHHRGDANQASGRRWPKPYGNACAPYLRCWRESVAQRSPRCLGSACTWKVVNPEVLNDLGDPVGPIGPCLNRTSRPCRGSLVECRHTSGVREQEPEGERHQPTNCTQQATRTNTQAGWPRPVRTSWIAPLSRRTPCSGIRSR